MSTTNYETQAEFDKDTYVPNFDKTGLLVDNKVLLEKHTIAAEIGTDNQIIVPLFAPFFRDGLSVSFQAQGSSTVTPLVEGLDYLLVYQFMGASRSCGKPIYGGINILNNQLTGKVILNTYQTLGGNWVLNMAKINEILANQIQNPKITSWEQIASTPTVFPVVDHEYNLQDQVGASEIVQAIEGITNAITEATPDPETGAVAMIQDHLSDPNDPHPQYITEEELSLLLQSNDFKGAFIGIANLTGTTYSLPEDSPFIDSIGLFTVRFNQANPEGCNLQLPGGSSKPITDHNGRLIPKGEIVAGENRVLVSIGDKYCLVDVKRYLGLTLPTTAFDPVSNLDAVRFNGAVLAKAIADGVSPNNAVVGFADKTAGKIVYAGVLPGFAGLTINETYYLSDTVAAGITLNKPKTDAIIVGIAKSATELFVSIMAAAPNDSVPIGGGDDKIWFGNDAVVTANFTLPANKNFMSAGPIEIGDDVNLTIPDTTNWTIL